MPKNGLLWNSKNLKLIQKALMAGVGATTSKEIIKSAVNKLLTELESRGQLKTKETKELVEKSKIIKMIKKDSRALLGVAKDVALTPLILANLIKKTVSKNKKTLKRKR